MDQYHPCVYILANRHRTVLYIGVTSNLPHRVWQHKCKLIYGFSRKYNTECLVWYESHSSMYSAITREKQIKKWNRDWKNQLIDSFNPEWKDQYDDLTG